MAVFRVEKTRDYTVMSNGHLRDRSLSLKAKGLLSLMLSLPEDWDYTMKGLAQISKEGIDAIRHTISELEQHGYLIRSRLRNEKGQLTETEYTIMESPCIEPRSGLPTLVKPTLAKPTQAFPTQEKPIQINTDLQKTKEEKTNPSIGADVFSVETIRQQVKNQIGYATLCHDHDPQRVEEIAGIIGDILCSSKETLSVGGTELPAAVVKERLRSLDQFHIDYVFTCFQQVHTEIRDVRSYLLTSLFNAPTTINHYYENQVKWDMERLIE